MENNQLEVAALVQVVEVREDGVRTLEDLALTFIGGGVGEATLA